MSPAKTAFRSFLRDEQGATMVEYGFMLVLIALVCVAGVMVLGNNTKTAFGDPVLLNAL
ncbi:MAG TPA: Flp family type IVb pilin [Gemmatimonadaceae bacterium]|nr:Flp family type IVb pilin [Gemmatimonadaceae bacterium]